MVDVTQTSTKTPISNEPILQIDASQWNINQSIDFLQSQLQAITTRLQIFEQLPSNKQLQMQQAKQIMIESYHKLLALIEYKQQNKNR